MTLLSAPKKSQIPENNPLLSQNDWDWLPYACEAAAPTMQKDRDLFERVKAGNHLPYIRFYRWEKPAISFGRTHDMTKVPQETFKADGWSIVQRPTGGGTVLHQKDLCFSIVWRKQNAALPWRINDSYLFIHKWIRNSLAALGHSCDFHKVSAESAYYGDALCFQNPVCSDLLEGGRKIVGGAQWRSHDVALHQGSIQLDLGPESLDIFKHEFEKLYNVRMIEPAASC